MLSKNWRINAIYRDRTTNHVTMVDFECEYSSTDFEGQKSVHSGTAYLSVQPAGDTVEDFVAALEATFAPQQAYMNQHHLEMLTFQHLEATLEKTIVTPIGEPLRALTARELRLTLLHFDILPTTVDTFIGTITDVKERATALTEWEYATTFERDHKLIDMLATALNLTESRVDEMWRYGMALGYTKTTTA